MLDQTIQEWRKEFPIFAYHESLKEPFVYFDNAATALKPRCVVQAMTDYYTKYTGNIHRGIHRGAFKASQDYEDARKKVARFIHALNEKEIIFTSGVTASINLFARSFCRGFLQPGDRAILTEMEHHSSLVCWQEMAKEFKLTLDFIRFTEDGTLDLSNLDTLLSAPTKLLAFTAISNTLGTINPVKLLTQKAHAHGVLVFVDAAQSVAHVPTNVQEDDIDFLGFSGHKLFGPTGVGVFWGKQALLQKLPPFFYGGGMIQEVDLEKATYLGTPHGFEAGTPPIAEVIGLMAAIDFVEQIGWDNLKKAEDQNKACAKEIFARHQDVIRIYGNSAQKVDLFSFHSPQLHAHDIGSYMSEMGIAVRAGHQCTQPITKHYGIAAVTRASASFYNLSTDWAYFGEKLEEMLRFFHVQ